MQFFTLLVEWMTGELKMGFEVEGNETFLYYRQEGKAV